METYFQSEWFQGKKVVVLGLARSGLAVSKLLLRFGAKVVVNDCKAEKELIGIPELRELGIRVIAGYHPEELIDEHIDLVVKNPGIPYHNVLLQQAEGLHIPIITEIELAYAWTQAPIIAITGSNGKTTTTSLIGSILEDANKRPIVAGNIGTVLCEKAVEAEPDELIIAELSSFQLKGTVFFRPYIACLLNVTPAHLDYHGTWDDYIESKAKLFANMKEEDIAVLNADSKECQEIAKHIQCKIIWFSRTNLIERGAYVHDGNIYVRLEQDHEQLLISTQDIAMPGSHNLENALAAVVVCKILGVEMNVMRQVLRSFQGVEHRLEFVSEFDEVKFYNNSKATNSEATMTALESFNEPIVLIAGGLDRGVDFNELIPLFLERVKALIVYGETKDKFVTVGKLAGLTQIIVVDCVSEAVVAASRLAVAGDVVLLSPSCASWDMYRSFEERGSIFKESVHRLKTSLH